MARRKRVKYARVPSGGETCRFCIMLASRGAVYATEDTASHAHANCDCRVVPVFDSKLDIEGYDPNKYYDMWKHPEKYADESTNVSASVDASGIDRKNMFNGTKDDSLTHVIGKAVYENKSADSIKVSGINVVEKNGGIISIDSGYVADEKTFFVNTCCEFKKPKSLPKGDPDYTSGSGSKYWYTSDGVYRASDHWGSGVASCNWSLEGRNEFSEIRGGKYGFKAENTLTDDSFDGEAVGFSEWSDFSLNDEVLPNIDSVDYMTADDVVSKELGVEYEDWEWKKDGKKILDSSKLGKQIDKRLSEITRISKNIEYI